jgi:N-acetylmuramoyl-L-alanine amidase
MTNFDVRQVTLATVAAALMAWPLSARQAPTLPSQPPVAPATVKSITRTALPRGDRITIELSREVTYAAARLPTPDRLFFDVPNSVVTSSTSTRAQSLTGTWIKGVRVGQHTETAMRIVLELAGDPRHSVFALYDPYRLVIDLERAPAVPDSTMTVTPRTGAGPVADISTRAASIAPVQPAASRPAPPAPTPAGGNASSAPTPTSAPVTTSPPASSPASPPDAAEKAPLLTTALSNELPAALRTSKPVTIALPAPPAATGHGDYSLARQLGLGVSRIVIDPGHGGHDPGAQGNGIDESNLVLDVSLRLEALLKAQPGFDVVMTRRTDTFVPLEERTAIANREGADLFLSIHANATHDVQVRGVETYFLSFATTQHAESVAARENATGGKTMGNLPEIVKTITLNNKLEESRELATMVQAAMLQDLTAPQRTTKDLGVKQAPFVVLIGAQMPSVLAEISFVTNKTDALQLKQNAFRQAIAQALFDAIVKYKGSLKRSVTPDGKEGGLH